MKKKSILLSSLMAVVLAAAGLVGVTTMTASAGTEGIWKITCGFSHTNKDDMIVLPGRSGASHAHDYFGNATTNARSTPRTLAGARTTCPNNDHASYWVPAVYKNGRKINPKFMNAYYTSSVDPRKYGRMIAFPPGFKMIAGNSKNNNPNAMGQIFWGCGDDHFITHNIPARCSDGVIQVRITFPSCWNGRIAANETPNMAYPLGGGKCPRGYPHAFPKLRVNANYYVGTPVGHITLSSGSASSAHADFVNEWDQRTLQRLVDNCLNAQKTCPHFK